jgi:hypothetical protein
MDNKKTFALITAVVVVSLWILGFPMVIGSLGYLLSHQYPRAIIMIYLAIGGVSLGVVLLITRLKMRKGIVARIPIVLLSLVVAAALTPSLLVTPEVPLILPSLLILLMFIEG